MFSAYLIIFVFLRVGICQGKYVRVLIGVLKNKAIFCQI